MDRELHGLLNSYSAAFGVEVSPEQWEKFETYMRLLTEWNGRINLTAITEPSEIVVKHFADSLSALPYIRKYKEKHGSPSLCDVGTGAGFPGVPLKIVFPEIKLTLVDSLDKRIVFLRSLTEALGLSDTKLLHARAEDAGRLAGFRDSFDVVTARAVAPMNVLLEYCAPLVRKGGIFISMKGSREENNFSRAASLLSVKLVSRDRFELSRGGDLRETAGNAAMPGTEAEMRLSDGALESSAGNDSFTRTIYVFEKTGPTPGAYPRKAGTPSKKPL